MIKGLLTSIFFLIIVLTSAAQGHEAAVNKAVEKLRIAMESGDKAALEKITSDKLSYGHSSGVIENKAEFVENIASGKSDFVSIDLSEQTITVSGKTAIVRHILKAKTNDNGKPGEVHLRTLLVFQKKWGKWKLLARQAVRVAS